MKNNLTFSYSLSREHKEAKNNHSSLLVWFFGLSGSGKSTLCNLVEKSLFDNKIKTVVFDGDTLREGLNNDLDFSQKNRDENIRRVSEISKILINNGLVTLCSFITPFERNRSMVNSIVGKKNILWIYVDTPIEICSKRDSKGLYKLAKEGKISNFTGVSSPFEEPKFYDIKTRYSDGINKISQSVSTLILKKILNK